MWQRTPDGWRHRPWWKVAINTVLRAVQTKRRPARLWVVATRCTEIADESGPPPDVLGYKLCKVTHL